MWNYECNAEHELFDILKNATFATNVMMDFD